MFSHELVGQNKYWKKYFWLEFVPIIIMKYVKLFWNSRYLLQKIEKGNDICCPKYQNSFKKCKLKKTKDYYCEHMGRLFDTLFYMVWLFWFLIYVCDYGKSWVLSEVTLSILQPKKKRRVRMYIFIAIYIFISNLI